MEQDRKDRVVGTECREIVVPVRFLQRDERQIRPRRLVLQGPALRTERYRCQAADDPVECVSRWQTDAPLSRSVRRGRHDTRAFRSTGVEAGGVIRYYPVTVTMPRGRG